MSIPLRIRHFLANNQIVLVLLALVLGVLYPDFFKPLSPYSTPMLMVIFFTSSLRLALSELVGFAKDWQLLTVADAMMMGLMPLAMWIPTALFAPEWALPFLIVGLMPTGLTIALVADLFGGKTSLAMLISAETSILAPFTIPLILFVLVGHTVAIPVFELFESLFLSIVVPFVLAMIVKARVPKLVNKHDLFLRETSLLLFALLVAVITASSSQGASFSLGWDVIGIVTLMIVFMGGIAWLAYALTAWRTPPERITVALCMVYMNNTLALYIGDKFFHEQHVVPKLLIILTAVNALLPPIKWAASRIAKKSAAASRAVSIPEPVI